MSEPAKSANEIEDVLASIRRLVSETHGAPAQVAQATAEPARLILTQAQRVSEPDDPWMPVPAADPAMPPETEDPAWGLEDHLSDWGEIEDSAQESVADAIAEQAMDMPAGLAGLPASPPAVRADESFSPQDEAPHFSEFEPETGDADWPQQGAPAALRHLALVRGQAQAEPSRPDRQHEPDGGAPEPATLSAGTMAPEDMPNMAEDEGQETAPRAEGVAPMTGDHPVEAVPQADVADTADADPADTADADPADTADADTADTADADTADTADADTADTADADTADTTDADTADADAVPRMFSRRVEVHRPARDDAAGAAAAQEAVAEASGSLDDEIEDLGEDGHMFTFPEPDEGTLDEDTLREIIADVVREELQGVLGQRITRNVRKMVRREIRLALAAQDLE